MINHHAASPDDLKIILGDLSDITKSEIDAVAPGVDVEALGRAMLSSGLAEISLSDSTPLFIVGHYPACEGCRGTWCLAGKATETLRRETLAAASDQVERMLKNHPSDQFTSVSYSLHPKRDWFFASMGFHKRIDYGDRAVFDLLPIAPSCLDS
jgi:hypothetical protein